MDRSWINSRLFSKAHQNGVSEFMKFVSERFDEEEEILCPCRQCLNHVYGHRGLVQDHLYIHGMCSTYDKWIHHGEPSDAGTNDNAGNLDDPIGFNDNVGMNVEEEGPDDDDDRVHEMVEELYTAEQQDGGDGRESMFAKVLEEMKKELYPGAAYTRFSFVVKLLHIKSFYRISNVAFTAILKLLSSAFPECSLPASYHEAKNLVRAMGLGYVSIHVCPKNCVLFRKEHAKKDKCPVCGESRWKDGDGKKKIPQKVLRHFPLIPRLKRMFASKKIAEEVKWHKVKRKPVENELSHPADGEAWKDFDREYEWFAQDPRNIRLGLATDGFNPFGKMNATYSMWPVFLVPYNFPPWVCMEQSNFMMGLLIPGPKCPAKDMDVFLEPLVEELLDLWIGVSTFDASSGKKFDLHAAVIWCIHDYPALSTLSGRVTRGYYACVRCDKYPCSKRIRNKICYIGHRRFLPIDHPWRRKKCFDGRVEERGKPEEFSIEELMQQLERVKDVRPGEHPQNRKRKREADGQCWKRRSILFDLPYWASLKLRHNLDIMHIEKNICEYIIGTFLGIVGKSKDTINGRLDLEDMGIRKNLHLKHHGEKYSVPHAPYTMNKDQKLAFCNFLRSVRFPDGYASNLAAHVTADGCNLQGLKTHDCHILLQRILPAAIRGIMPKDIYEAIAELGNFFQQLCAKTLKVDVLHRLKAEIPIIICKRPRPAEFSDEQLTDYERERVQNMMRNNRVFRSLGLTQVASILNNSSHAKSKGVSREDPDPLYEPAGDEDGDEYDTEHGVVDKVVETRSVIRPTGGTGGSKRVSAGPIQQDLGARVMTRKRTRDQSSSEGGINGTYTNEEDDVAAPVPAAPAEVDEEEEMENEGEPNALINQRSRGRSMGKELDKMCRGLNSKLPVVIVEGKRRPEAPIQAAKLASEAGIVLRQHMPIFTRWKDYKEDSVQNFMGKVSANFSMDIKDKAVESACTDLLKGGQRQMRHRLKKAYFDDVPANQVRTTSPLKSMTDDQWRALIEMWSTPKHKDKCLKAKMSRENVKYPHKTGSRCYIAQAYAVTKDKYKDAPPTAIDLFRDLHYSSKTGLSEPVKEAIDQMEAIVAEPTEEGQDPKNATEAVAEVLPKSKFLLNIGLQASVPKKSATTAVNARVQELEAEVQVERQSSAALRCQIEYQQNQLEDLTSKFQETEAANKKQQEELETLKKQGEETNSLLRRLLSLSKD